MPLVHCSFLDNVVWDHQPSVSPGQADVHIWRLSLSAGQNFLRPAFSLLTQDERERANRYYQEKDKHRFILSRAMLRLVVSGYTSVPAQNIRFSIGPNKKPFLHGLLDINYNVSHAGDLALIAISCGPIGVDVERIDPAYQYEEVVPGCFSYRENNFLKTVPDPRKSFYLFWTRKEALTKATAKGIDDDLKFVPSLDGLSAVMPEKLGSCDDWTVKSFHTADQYIASVAHTPAIQNIFFSETDHFWHRLITNGVQLK
jgi:4'-phosphopantetheinyl transferase